jgi:asparagine synthase (glutamine-hydrolysing)
MCGIAGYISFGPGDADESALRAMTRAVKHRGPDDEGVLVQGRVGFGHRRLAIVDLSADGHQPMRERGGSLVIVFNGEIYNYVELREQLQALGHSFATATDTEVIIHAYRAWGDACVERFNGMWAFAIHDPERNRVFMSRDRFGVKPFYYAMIPGAMAFGSEIRQLLPLLPQVRANRKVVSEFLSADVCEPREETFFEGVRKLPGSHSMVMDLTTNGIEVSRYYSIPERPEFAQLDVDASCAAYRECLEKAVTLRLRADVPVGTCLSGGLDSSSIATLAAGPYREKRGEAFRGITAESEQESNDESALAREVAGNAGIDWIGVKPTYHDFATTIEDVARAQEEPFGGPSVCMQYFVMRTARQHSIPVLLDGQGGDETLLGYRHYFAGIMRSVLRRRGFRAMLGELRECRRNRSQMSSSAILVHFVFYSSAWLQQLLMRRRNRYLRERPVTTPQQREFSGALSDLARLQRLEIERTNLPALLRFEDKNSMWHAIETRLPFLDYRSVECALSLPVETKFHGGWTKYVLRRAMDSCLPASITWRIRKIGFEAPSAIWLREHAGEMRREVLASPLIAGLSRPGILERSYDGLHHAVRWRLYSVALWARLFGVT